ncbi:MAG: hypothetical protein JXQ73_02355 [Phycisphaerae bacterium]|nr:hypothetical protein [Phycisphaerae bacterium]
MAAGLMSAVGCGDPQATTKPAQQTSMPTAPGGGKVLGVAVVLPPMIDGKLEEGIWRDTPAYSGFVAVGTTDQRPKRDTEFRVAYDAGNLFMALRCPIDTSAAPPKVRHWQEDDEAIDEDESCVIQLWPQPHRPEVTYEFKINPQGVVCDSRRYWGFPLTSTGWDGPTQAAAVVSDGAWTAEIRVPLIRLGIPEKPWHVNVFRHDAEDGVRSSLMPAAASAIGSTGAGELPPRAVLEWPMPAKPFTTGPLPPRQLRLADMEESKPAWQGFGAEVAVSTEHATSGRQSLQVSFQAGTGHISLAPAQGNFSGWETLRLSVFVADETPVPLGIRLRDVFGRTRTACFAARGGANDIVLPLDLLGAGLRLRNIKGVELFSRKSATVWIDHVRLEEDTLSLHEIPHRPGRPSTSSLVVGIAPAVLADLPASLPIAVDVTAALYHTQKVRRLQRRSTGMSEPIPFGPEAFDGHDARDPVRVMAFFETEGIGFFAFHELRLTQPQEQVIFGPEDFALPGPRATSATAPRS